MIPIHELLHRIRWDRDFGAAQFTLGYYDRIERRIITVPFAEIAFSPEDHFDFNLIDAEGTVHTIPLHRIRQLFRNGELIWERRVEEL